MDGHSEKQGHTRTDRVAIYGISSDQKESPLGWTPHEDVTRQATKAVFYYRMYFGHRKRGRPRRRFKDAIKQNLKLRDMKTD